MSKKWEVYSIRNDCKITLKTYTTEDDDRTGDSNKVACHNNLLDLENIYKKALKNIKNNYTLPRIISDIPLEEIKEVPINLFERNEKHI